MEAVLERKPEEIMETTPMDNLDNIQVIEGGLANGSIINNQEDDAWEFYKKFDPDITDIGIDLGYGSLFFAIHGQCKKQGNFIVPGEFLFPDSAGTAINAVVLGRKLDKNNSSHVKEVPGRDTYKEIDDWGNGAVCKTEFEPDKMVANNGFRKATFSEKPRKNREKVAAGQRSLF